MATHDRILNAKDQTIQSLKLIVIVLSIALSISIYLQYKTNTGIVVHLPPDLTKLTKMQANEIPNHTVFAFTYTIFQKLNTWEQDGEKDFPRKLNEYRHYLSEEYRAQLVDQMTGKLRRGELGKIRHFTLYPGRDYQPERIKQIGNQTWVVILDGLIREYVNGMNVKVTAIRYPIVVSYRDINLEKNPWKLQLVGYADKGPQTIPYNKELMGLPKGDLTGNME